MALQSLSGLLLKSGTVPWSAMVSGAIVPIASIVGGSALLNSAGTVAMVAALNLGGFTAQNSGAPINATDLVTKSYVDAKTGGIGGIHDVRVLANVNVTIASPGTALDGVTLTAGDVFLAINQTTTSQNGPWTFNGSASAATRPAWWGSGVIVNEGQYFLVAEGTTFKDSKFWLTTVGTITVDTTATAFTQDLSGTVYTAGAGLGLVGGQFSVNYGTASGTAAQGNDSRITGALQTSALGTGVQTALAVAASAAGGVLLSGGALGTPSSGTLSGCTGLPLAGLTGLGASVATALSIAVGSAGAVVTNGGALGTPSSANLSSATNLPISTGVSGLGTGVAAALAVATGAANGLPVLAAGGFLAAANHPALTGDVTSSAGSLSTVINNVAGSGFTKYGNFVPYEVPSGTINGSNATFTLANTPAACKGGVSSLTLYLDGLMMQAGAGNDYTISGNTITMLRIPQTGDTLIADYMV